MEGAGLFQHLARHHLGDMILGSLAEIVAVGLLRHHVPESFQAPHTYPMKVQTEQEQHHSGHLLRPCLETVTRLSRKPEEISDEVLYLRRPEQTRGDDNSCLVRNGENCML